MHETVNLGEKSQPLPKIQHNMQSFNLVKDLKSTQKGLSVSAKSKVIQEKKKVPKKPTLLNEIGSVRPKHALNKPTNIPPSGKENIDATRKPTNLTENHGQPQPMPLKPINVPMGPPSSTCYPPPYPPGENNVCGPSHGVPLPHSGELPDSSTRGGVPVEGGPSNYDPRIDSHDINSQ